MKLLNFKETKETVMFVLKSSTVVPMIMGERGIGKSTLVKTIAKELGWEFVKVDCNSLNPGEIGGMPHLKEVTTKNGTKSQVFKYAPHVALKNCINYTNKGKDVLLFFDEINRCDGNVKREIMNVILDKSINGLELGDNVHVVAACNPSSDFSENYEDSEYQVEDMDEAQKDRFCWIAMKSDPMDWLEWGEKNGINQITLEFISDHSDLLNNLSINKTSDIKTSERSWEWVSQLTDNYENMSENILLTAISGLVGTTIAAEYVNFIFNNENPLIKPKEIFEGESFNEGHLTEDVFERITNETILRKHLLSRNVLHYMEKAFEKEKTKKSKTFEIKKDLFIEFLTKALNNSDMMYSILLDLNLSKDENDKNFLKYILSLKNINILNAFTKLNQSF